MKADLASEATGAPLLHIVKISKFQVRPVLKYFVHRIPIHF